MLTIVATSNHQFMSMPATSRTCPSTNNGTATMWISKLVAFLCPGEFLSMPRKVARKGTLRSCPPSHSLPYIGFSDILRHNVEGNRRAALMFENEKACAGASG